MERRLEELEVRMSYLEKGLTDLDNVVQELGAGLDDLKAEMAGLRTTVTESLGGTEKADLRSDKPPHY